MRRFGVIMCACALSVMACTDDDRDNESTDNDVSDTDTVDNGDPDIDGGDTDPDDHDSDPGDTQTDDGPPVLLEPPARGFQVVSPELTFEPGPGTATCYYFRSSNTEAMAVNRFASAMSAGGYHVELYRTSDDVLPPGSVSSETCGHRIAGTDYAQWLYSAAGVEGDLTFPADESADKPLALDVAPNTPMYLRVEAPQSPSPGTLRVVVNAHALEAGTDYKKTAPYLTDNGSISIPNNATMHVEASACGHSNTALFWMMTMHAHKQATKLRILNSGYMAYEQDDWQDPTPVRFALYRFVGDITYECTYANDTGRTVSDGNSPVTDEVCRMMGYFYEEGDNPVVPRACYTPTDGDGFTFPAWP